MSRLTKRQLVEVYEERCDKLREALERAILDLPPCVVDEVEELLKEDLITSMYIGKMVRE